MIILENVYVAAESKVRHPGDMWFRENYAGAEVMEILYDLLGEREAHQNISHKEMPTFEEHCKFVQSDPYKAWYLIITTDSLFGTGEIVGAIYLTYSNEIGIQIFRNHQGQGYGEQAIRELAARFKGPFLANINPDNEGSIRFFKKLGAKHLQNTYIIEEVKHEDNNSSVRNTDRSLN